MEDGSKWPLHVMVTSPEGTLVQEGDRQPKGPLEIKIFQAHGCLLDLVGNERVKSLPCHPSEPIPVPNEWYQQGDFVIGGMVSMANYQFNEVSFKHLPSQEYFENPEGIARNKEKSILFHNENLLLCEEVFSGILGTFLFNLQQWKSQVQCSRNKNRVGLLTYGSFTPQDVHSTEIPYYYSMVPNESSQYIGIIRLLQHFGWRWVGLFAIDNIEGEHFLQIMESLFSQHGVCSACMERIPYLTYWDKFFEMFNKAEDIFKHIIDEKIKTFIFYGESLTNA
ncbi:hypothetical protein E2320_003524, partial [Naja naja]